MHTKSPGEAAVLLLVGGGHAHVAVLADWIRHGAPSGVRAVLLTPDAVPSDLKSIPTI